jgi:hypothetical protein
VRAEYREPGVLRLFPAYRATLDAGVVTTPHAAKNVTGAGWYPDPGHEAALRYWDGCAWTPWIADESRKVSLSEHSIHSTWEDPTKATRQPAIRIFVGVALVTNALYLLNPNLRSLGLDYWFDNTSVVAVWLWVAAIDAVWVLVLLAVSRTFTLRRAALGIIAVAIVCIPIAFVAQDRLPTNTVHEYRAVLDQMERHFPEMRLNGSSGEYALERCKNAGIDGTPEPAYLERHYGVFEGTNSDVIKRVQDYLNALGLPDTEVSVGDLGVEQGPVTVTLEKKSCSVLEGGLGL